MRFEHRALEKPWNDLLTSLKYLPMSTTIAEAIGVTVFLVTPHGSPRAGVVAAADPVLHATELAGMRTTHRVIFHKRVVTGRLSVSV